MYGNRNEEEFAGRLALADYVLNLDEEKTHKQRVIKRCEKDD